jgi:ornithine cyclodeaminase/alanine dehydrogenase-like protein (mu-crystallin family)
MTLILSNADIAEILTIEDCIGTLEDAFIELAEGRGAFRRRSDICTPTDYDRSGMYVLRSMDGVAPALSVAAIRINSDIITFPEINGSLRRVRVPAAPNDRYTGLVLLFSTRTGEPLAIFPDGTMQPMRVAATSALGAKCLARDDAATVAILGSGGQARSQARAIVHVRPVKRIRCYSPSRANREAFARTMSPIGEVDVQVVDSAREAVDGADIVLCATNSSVPVFQPDWIQKGMHVSAIQPAELPAEVVRRADVAATLMEDCDPVYIKTHGIRVPEEPSTGQQNLAEQVGWEGMVTLPELLLHRKHGRNASKGRTSDDQFTCFLNPMGIGYQFAAVGAVIYRRAKELQRGNDVPTDWFTEKEFS